MEKVGEKKVAFCWRDFVAKSGEQKWAKAQLGARKLETEPLVGRLEQWSSETRSELARKLIRRLEQRERAASWNH